MKMSKKNNTTVFYEMGDLLGVIKESDTTDWSKIISYFNWISDKKKGDKETIDIRNYNFKTNQMGKGISLSVDECEKLTSILLENDFANIDDLKKALKKKMNFFASVNEIEDGLTDDGLYHINI